MFAPNVVRYILLTRYVKNRSNNLTSTGTTTTYLKYEKINVKNNTNIINGAFTTNKNIESNFIERG